MEETKIHTLPYYVLELAAAASVTWDTACIAGSSAIKELLAHYSLDEENENDRNKFHELRRSCSNNDYDIFVGVKDSREIETMQAIYDVDHFKWEKFEKLLKSKYDTEVKRSLKWKKGRYYEKREKGEVDYYLQEVLCVVPIKVTTDVDKHKTVSKKVDIVFVDIEDCKDSFNWSYLFYDTFDIDIAAAAIKIEYGANNNRILSSIQIHPAAEENLKMGRLDYRVQRHANFKRMLSRMIKYRNKGFSFANISFDQKCEGQFERAANEYVAHVFQNELVQLADKEKCLPQDAQRKIAEFMHIPDMMEWEKDKRDRLILEEAEKPENRKELFKVIRQDPFSVFSHQIAVRAAKVITKYIKSVVQMKRQQRTQQSKRKLDEALEKMWHNTNNKAE